MATSAQQTDKTQGIEYSIYTFDASDGGKKGEKQDVKSEMRDALALAEELVKSGKYKKVEVTQKYFDKKKNRNIDMTLKTLHAKKKLEINAAMIFVFAVLCGAVAFGLTYVLTS